VISLVLTNPCQKCPVNSAPPKSKIAATLVLPSDGFSHRL
jgi:hypothetical protein